MGGASYELHRVGGLIKVLGIPLVAEQALKGLVDLFVLLGGVNGEVWGARGQGGLLGRFGATVFDVPRGIGDCA